MSFVYGVFIVLHALVHLLYFGQSARRFELKAGMDWPDGSWALSRLIGNGATRNLASISFILVAIAFATGGIGILVSQSWWRPMVLGAAAVSSIAYILFWNGKLRNLDGQGALGLLINIVILATVLLLGWPPISP